MVMGDPLDEKTDIGTIISTAAIRQGKRLHRDRRGDPGRHGAALLAMPADAALALGYFVRPVIFTGLANVAAGAGGDLRAGDRGVPVRRAEDGVGGGERQRFRPGRLGVDQ